jgi:hypothetical protein
MMHNVGFHGGHSIYELGPASDVHVFFKCIEKYAVEPLFDQKDRDLIDRIFRRYLKQTELEPASKLLIRVRECFSKIGSSTVDWAEINLNVSESKLNIAQPNLADIFINYFEMFEKAKNSALSFLSEFKIYQPVKTVISDLAGFTEDDIRPLERYDALSGPPFWLRDNA